MPSLNVQVTLSEALEVQGQPLDEPQLWSLLCQAAEAIQDLFITGSANDSSGPCFAITPDTLLLCGNGRIKYLESSFTSIKNPDYVPPEYGATLEPTDTAVEKMYVYALGMTAYAAADFNLEEDTALQLSNELDSLISGMCEEEPSLRMALVHVLEVCFNQCPRFLLGQSPTHYTIGLYKLVLGSDQQLDEWFKEEHIPLSSSNIPRSRSSSHHREHSLETRPRSYLSRSRSRSKSRSRSRSRSRDRKSHLTAFKERPLPIGKAYSEPHQDGAFIKGHRDRYSQYMDQQHRNTGELHNLKPASYSMTPSVYHSEPTTLPGYGPTGRMLHDIYEGPVPYKSDDVPQNWSSLSRKKPHQRDSHKHLYETYERLKRRRQKLHALRQGISLDEAMLAEDMMSSHSDNSTDFGDRKSLPSSVSYNRGIYQPDLHSQYGSQVALKMTHSLQRDGEDSMFSNELAMLERQRKEMGIGQQMAPHKRFSPGLHSDEVDKNLASSDHHQSSSSQSAPPVKVKQKPKPREFTGPEFVVKSNNPVINLNIPQEKATDPSKMRHVQVILLDGQRLDVTCDPSNLGRHLVDIVICHLNIPEHYYFGITYVLDGEHFFLDPDMKLSKVAPADWKDPGKKHVLPVTFTTYFRLQFYVDKPDMIKHDETKHMYYLQLRRDILEGRTQCTEDQVLFLAAIALQAEYGDHSSKDMNRNYFVPEHYIPQRLIRKMGSAYARDTLPGMHKQEAGLSQQDAEMKFVQEASLLPEYGIHFYRVYRSKKDMVTPLWTGIGTRGVVMAEKQGDHRQITNTHPWHYTQKISFNKKRFSILPKSEAGPIKSLKMNYYTDSHKKGRYLLQQCTAAHRFQMKMRSMANLPDMFEEEYPVEAGRSQSMEDLDDEEHEHQSQSHRRKQPAKLSRYEEPAGVCSDSDDEELSGLLPGDRIATADITDIEAYDPDEAYVIGHSFSAADLGMWPSYFEPISDTMMNRFEYAGTLEAPERRVLVVELQKDAEHGIGITIVGGDHTSRLDLGIFVQSVTPGGPADKDGRIQPGDRIIAINGQSLEGMPHHVAVDLIRKSHQVVQLMISQGTTPLPLSRNSSPSINELTVEELIAAERFGGRLPAAPPSDMSHGQPDGADDEPVSVQAAVDVHSAAGDHQDNVSTPRHVPDLPSSVDSSDIELEDILPPEALTASSRRPQTQASQSSAASRTSESHSHCSKQTLPRRDEQSKVSPTTPIQNSGDPPENVTSLSHVQTPVADNVKPDVDTSPLSAEKECSELREKQQMSVLSAHIQEGTDGDIESVTEAEENSGKQASPLLEGPASAVASESASSSNKASVEEPSNTSMSKSWEPGSSDAPCAKEELIAGDQYDVLVEKVNGSLGLNVSAVKLKTGCKSTILVKSITPGGAAEANGQIQIGDQIIEINGVSLVGATHKQAVETVRNSPAICKIKLQRGVPPEPKSNAADAAVPDDSILSHHDSKTVDQCSHSGKTPEMSSTRQNDPISLSEVMKEFPFLSEADARLLHLERDDMGFGFSIRQRHADQPEEVRGYPEVKVVYPHGAAAKDGRLQEGDVVLKVNDHLTKGMPVTDVLMLLRMTPSHLELLVWHPQCDTAAQGSTVSDSGKHANTTAPPTNDNTEIGIEQVNVHDQTKNGTVKIPKEATESEESTNQYPSNDSDDDITDIVKKFEKPQILRDSSTSEVNQTDSSKMDNVASLEKPLAPVTGIISSKNAVENVKTLSQEKALSAPSEALSPVFSKQREPSSPGSSIEQQPSSSVGSIQQEASSPVGSIQQEASSSVGSIQPEALSPVGSIQPEALSPVGSIQREALSPVSSVQPGESIYVTDTDFDSTTISFATEGSTTRGSPRVSSPVSPIQTPQQTPSPSSFQQDTVMSASESLSTQIQGPPELGPGEYDVTLTKGEHGLGFTVAGGRNTTGFCYVKDIIYDPAQSDGRIRKGDQLVMVNGMQMKGLVHKEAVACLRQAPATVWLRFLRPGATPRTLNPKNDILQEIEQELQKQSPQLSDSNTDADVSDLARDTDPEELPSVQSLIKSMEAQKTLIKPKEYGRQQGSEDLMPVEEIGIDRTLENMPPTPPSPLSQNTPVSESVADCQVAVTEGGITLISLEKPETGGLGFSIVQGERANTKGVFIKTITEGGVAAKDGRLRIGDRLIQVNGESLVGMPHKKIVGILRNASGTVSIAISRPASRPNSQAGSPFKPPSRSSISHLPLMDPPQLSSLELLSEESDTDSDREGALQAFIDSVRPKLQKADSPVKPVVEHGCDTNSDVGSETFDEQSMLRLHIQSDKNRMVLPESHLVGDCDKGLIDLTKDELQQFENGQDADKVLQEKNKSPKKPPRRKSSAQLLAVLSDEWLSSQPLVRLQADSMHYKGTQGAQTLQQLKAKVQNDEPVEEYKGLRHAKLTDNCNAARRPENRNKNRYRNVLPYDATRVLLSGDDDYINASHIRVTIGKETQQYIASQGPLPNTSGDFWRMVWEQEVQIIAMLTLDKENTKSKCHRYWPNTQTEPIVVDNRYQVGLLEEQQVSHFVVRQLRMDELESGESRVLYHLNFTSWPDHGAPDVCLPLLQFVRYLRTLREKGPLLVHCSAGIGRTGALITIDCILSYVEKDMKFDIVKLVQDIRRQRQGMIQTQDQYLFCYRASVELLETAVKP